MPRAADRAAAHVAFPGLLRHIAQDAGLARPGSAGFADVAWFWLSRLARPVLQGLYRHPNLNCLRLYMGLDIAAAYLAYRRELVNHLARIVLCRETARDLVQDSYVALARTAAVEQPRAFLYRTATNLALDHLRHRKVVERHAEIAAQAEEAGHPSSETEAAAAEGLELLRQAVAELPPRCRDAFILHKIQGLSYREVGEALGISQSAVEKHIIKGLLHCRARLGPHFVQPQGPG